MKLATLILNLRQRLRSLCRHTPLLCHYANGDRSLCNHGCASGEVFQCEVCNRLLPYCMGASDKYESVCDNCWTIANQLETAVAEIGASDDPE